ncbi:hypothetical protein J4461_02545 [Candidatus Pacearchaeota archaeon]|nr:hypothetical protein [Candidatus Pacearchaeota archaeon]
MPPRPVRNLPLYDRLVNYIFGAFLILAAIGVWFDFMQGIPGFGEVFRSPALESIIIVIGLLMLFFSAMKARFIFLGILTMIIGVLLLLPAVGVQMVMFEALSGSFINAFNILGLVLFVTGLILIASVHGFGRRTIALQSV